jgi:exodeoxyribonuclease V alpha subunit
VENSPPVHSSRTRFGGDSGGGGEAHETLEGQVYTIVFQAEDRGFAVVVINVAKEDRSEDIPANVTAAGDMGDVKDGEFLRLHGKWKTHPRFGRQFQAQWSEHTTPTTIEGLEKYLASGSFPGIGPDMSHRLTEHFGDQTLEALEAGPSKLLDVPGIGPKRAAVLAQAFAEGRAKHRVMAELRGLALNASQAHKLYERWQAAAIERVKADPYALIGELRGIGFETAERMARQLQIPTDSVVRGKGVILHLLRQGLREGHTCLPEQMLNEQLLRLGLSEETSTQAIAELIENRRLVCEEESGAAPPDPAAPSPPENAGRWYFHPSAHDCEVQIGADFHRLNSQQFDAAATPDQVMAAIQRAAYQPDPSQLRAVEMALRESFSVLTGGPGTGKTTSLRLVLDILEAAGVGPIRLASPTGRAAKRLHEATGRQAGTVHRLLGWDPIQSAWRHDEDDPIDAAYLIVDEVSMLDIFVAAALLRAVPDNCRVLLVGDADQLPSVSAGAVLRDLTHSRNAPQTRLELVHRQGSGSGIVLAAHSILQGHPPTTSTADSGDFFITYPENPDDAADLIERIVCERIPERYGLDPQTDILVLSPMYRGPLGVDALNQRLAQRLNPDGEGAEWTRGLRTGDRVMVVRNDYEREVFNGDTGFITHIERDELFVEIDSTVHNYGREEIGDLIPAYCVTVHRSQGSEALAVVVALSSSHYMMLRRNLLYTAVTRGKKLVTVVSDPNAFRRAVSNAEESRRWTRLTHRLDI